MRKTYVARCLPSVTGIIVLSFALLTGFAVGQSTRHKKKAAGQRPQTATSEIKYQPDADLLKQIQAQVTIVESKQGWKNLNRQRPIVNKSGGFSAYIAEFEAEPNSDSLVDVIVVHKKLDEKFYEIRGFGFGRPFERLRWTSSYILQFDQWVNPQNGGRYAINLKTGKVISAGYLRAN